MYFPELAFEGDGVSFDPIATMWGIGLHRHCETRREGPYLIFRTPKGAEYRARRTEDGIEAEGRAADDCDWMRVDASKLKAAIHLYNQSRVASPIPMIWRGTAHELEVMRDEYRRFANRNFGTSFVAKSWPVHPDD